MKVSGVSSKSFFFFKLSNFIPGKVESSLLNLRDGECWLNIKQLKLTSEDELRLFYVSNKTYVVVLFNSVEELSDVFMWSTIVIKTTIFRYKYFRNCDPLTLEFRNISHIFSDIVSRIQASNN